ncbi:hypothetical protein [Methylobacterium sp. J-070]|uniref:hypothetical protein n=1 Tax=Methylobacterium sp. J-070 TaxID=2836650 RepID=UPI001FBA5DDD|nr:hypothetical protein [Methylobacterium sp. J-070]MCJ2051696.1 hypothetical protein [Methylobacterium sp. J-070]
MMDDDLVPQARALAHATGTNMILRLLVAKIEELHPGTADELYEQVEVIADQLATSGNLETKVINEVITHAKGILATRNT